MTDLENQLLEVHGPDNCHICGKPKTADGGIYCSYPHGMLRAKQFGDTGMWTWKRPERT